MTTYSIEQLRDYSSLFSTRTGENSLQFNDVEDLHVVYKKYASQKSMGRLITGWDFLADAYRILKRYYRNEYVYKNELLNQVLLKTIGRKDTVILNELPVGNSVADIAFFNGTSKAFEIKSDLDSDKRLIQQLEDYKKLFEECYIVIPETNKDRYLTLIDDSVGVLVLNHSDRGALTIKQERPAAPNGTVDIDVLMRTVHTAEYKWMVKCAFGSLPDTPSFGLFDACKEQLSLLSATQLHNLFNTVMKRRKTNLRYLKSIPSGSKQMILSLNPEKNNIPRLIDLYNHNLNY